MKRKLLLIATLALVAMLAFAACTPTVEEDDDIIDWLTQTPDTPDRTVTDPSDNEEGTQPGEEGFDYGWYEERLTAYAGGVIDLSPYLAQPLVEPLENLQGDLNVWSFTNEALVIATAFQGMHPDLNINFRMASMDDGSYQEMVALALAAGTGDIPDVIFLEADFVRTFVQEDGWLANISELLPNAAALETIPFTVQAGMADGQARAFSYQATPGAMFFRRSMAERYFGTSDPAELQPLFANLELFLEAGRSIYQQSEGRTRIVSSPTEVYRTFLPNRANPWVVNNRLHVDPLMLQFMDFAYTMRSENLDAQAGQWQDHWFQAMSDTLVDAAGEPLQVFSFFMPTWGLPFVIMQNAGETFGDWGIIPGPMPFQWGGTWVGVTEAARNHDAAVEFVRFATLDEEHLTRWATGYYTNEVLAAINPDVPGDLSQPAGDLVSSARLIRELEGTFEGTETSLFIGGQNPYTIFGEAAMAVRFHLQQGTDNTIGDAFIEATEFYVTGETDRAGALRGFRDDVQMALPNLSW